MVTLCMVRYLVTLDAVVHSTGSVLNSGSTGTSRGVVYMVGILGAIAGAGICESPYCETYSSRLMFW